jgi:hypothetical protein
LNLCDSESCADGLLLSAYSLYAFKMNENNLRHRQQSLSATVNTDGNRGACSDDGQTPFSKKSHPIVSAELSANAHDSSPAKRRGSDRKSIGSMYTRLHPHGIFLFLLTEMAYEFLSTSVVYDAQVYRHKHAWHDDRIASSHDCPHACST